MECAARYQEQPTQGTTPSVKITFPDGTQVGSDDADVNSRLSRVLGKRRYAVATAASQQQATLPAQDSGCSHLGRLSRFQSLSGSPTWYYQSHKSRSWDVRRFRPNFLIQTNNEFEGLIEAGWNGRTLLLSAVELKCEIPTARCGMTSHGHSGHPKDPSVLRSIVKDANQNLGVYASVVQGGGISLGDPVELL